MIRITKQTDYGIVLTSYMAGDAKHVFNAPELAEETRLPVPMVSKILKHLARHGILTSYRGANGGYSLARAAEEIPISEVIAALEGPVAMTECIDDSPGACDQEAICPMRGNWQLINHAIRSALDAITLAEMAQPLSAGQLTENRLVTLGSGTETAAIQTVAAETAR